MPTSRPPSSPTCRLLAPVLAGALAVVGCTTGPDGEGTTGTTAAAVTCPDGSRPADAPTPGAPVSVPPAETEASAAPRDGVLDIGVLLPRSGDLAFLGPAPAAGVALAVDDLDAAGGVLGAPVTTHLADSAPDAAGAAEAETDRLLAAGVDVVVGPVTSGVTARVLERVRAAGSLLVSPGSTSPGLDQLDGGGRLFRTAATDDLQGRALAELVLDDGARSAALAVRGDDYGRAIADAFATRFVAGDGRIASRVEYDPADPALPGTVTDGLDTGADAIVVVGLGESARVLEALARAGHGPQDRPVYGTDGNLGDRLADLVDDRSSVACLRGLLPIATADDAFTARLRRQAPDLAGAPLDHAAEAYDAVVVVALAAEAAGTDDAGAVAGALRDVTEGGTPCREVAACLAAAGRGEDLAYLGASGALALDEHGNRTAAALTVVALDEHGRLRRTGVRSVRG